MRYMAVAASLVLVCGGIVPIAAPVLADSSAAAGSTVIPYDFDGDGYADMTVGVVGEDLRGVVNAGAAQVLYGSSTGVTSRDQVWHQGTKGVKGALERGDGFGWALASRDFDGDGYADLAVGVPNEDIRTTRNAGAVQVLYGSAGGLTTRDQIWHQGTPGVPGGNQRDDMFGATLAAGDFDGDGYADLAIGLPYDKNGAVVLLPGSSAGLTSTGAVRLRQGKDGMPSTPAGYENFGRELAVGDIDGDALDDLFIGVAFESDNLPSDDAPGSAVHVLRGSATGVSPTGSQYILPADLGLPAYWQIGDMTLSDFNADGRDDLVLSSNVTTATVAVLHGHTDGLHPAALTASTTPGTDAVWAIPWWDDDTGPNVAAGDLTGDGYADLAVEIDRGTRVVLGTVAGLGVTDASWPANFSEWTDLAALPFSGGTHAWLAVNTHNDVAVSRGATDGTSGPVEVWSQASPGIKGAKERRDMFGQPIGH